MKQTHNNRLRRAIAPLLLFCLVTFLSGARADLLVTESGESLSGNLTRVSDGILVFRTSLKGQMMLPMSEVKSLTTEKDWVVTQVGGMVHVGRFVPEGITGATTEGGDVQVNPIALSAVESAKPVAGQENTAETRSAPWRVEAGAGLRAFEGTRDGMAPTARLGVTSEVDQINTSLQLHFDAEGRESIPNYLSGALDVTKSADRSWAPFLQGTLERNTDEALNMRTGLTVGVRYQFHLAEPGQLEGLVGVGASYGEWNREFLERRDRLREGGDEEQADLNVHLGLRYSRTLLGGALWSSGIYLQPSLTDADDVRAGATSSVVYPVTNRLQLRLEMLMNYDNDPAFSSLDHVNTSVGASLEWNF